MPRACTLGSCFERLDRPGEFGGVAAAFAASLAAAGWEVETATRIGDDPAGEAARAWWRSAGIGDTSVQCDPDLATGRWTRHRRGSDGAWLEAPAAFDHLQWDADLGTAASRAEVVVTDLIGRRNAQARSTIDRALLEARAALRVLDLTSAGTAGIPTTDSAPLRSGLEHADLAIVDEAGLRWCGVPRDRDLDVLRRGRASMVLAWNSGSPIRLAGVDGEVVGSVPIPESAMPADALVAFLGETAFGGTSPTSLVAELDRSWSPVR